MSEVPTPRRSGHVDLAQPRVFVALGLLAIAALYLMPSAAGPECPVHMVAGIKCPGCGSLRASHALLRGDLRGAWQYNPALVLTVALTPIVLAALYVARRRLSPTAFGRLCQLGALFFGAFAILWMLARNVWQLDAA